ncbi:MAG: beta-galactosidase [Candidatus Omnitrophica bacterium]|nr:beta-galactosidase [Candidatus Omnitrophota bacterium]
MPKPTRFLWGLTIALLLTGLTALPTAAANNSENLPRPEHPMPQMERAEWLNLNGTWEFAETQDNNDEQFLTAETFPDTITVPFCRESRLSGLQRTGFMKNVWYRRTFAIPADWKSPRIRLNIGACDWITRVWINGTFIGRHRGGNVAFGFDITEALKPGKNTVVIHAFDDTPSGLQPLGKQSNREKSYAIFYTRTTGIWQTVWLEGLGDAYLSDFHIIPDPDRSRILIQAEVDGPSQGLTLLAQAEAAGKTVGQDETAADWRNIHLTLDLNEKRLWSLDDPFLYDLVLTLKRGGQVIDQVKSYFGLRKVSIQGAAILINDQPIFQRLVLDQGFYPDGVWTAPSDEALKRDIELSKAVGFNGARLHQKVFEPRFLYWADRLGYLVWGEYPSFGANYGNPVVNVPITQEWVEIVRRDRNHPSIIGWCPFNETPPEAGEIQRMVIPLTRALDPTRPVIETSGWTHTLADPEVLDAHDYNQNPVTFRQKWDDYFTALPIPARYAPSSQGLPFFISEYGGIGWFEAKDRESWGYGNNPKTLEEFYERYAGLTNAQLDNRNLFGFCYTQLTDVEQEKNGIYQYDRTPKFDAEKLRVINSRKAAYEENPPIEVRKITPSWKVLVGAVPDGEQAKEWRYVLNPPGGSWTTLDYDDSAWNRGRAGFGRKEGWENRIRTPWTGKDIWLRQKFEYDGSPFDTGALVTHYDNATEVYVNGEKIWSREGWNNNYEGFQVTEALHQVLRQGTNVIAIHCHQDEGGQYIDAALLIGEAK